MKKCHRPNSIRKEGVTIDQMCGDTCFNRLNTEESMCFKRFSRWRHLFQMIKWMGMLVSTYQMD